MPSDVRQNISFFKSRFNTPATIEGGHSISRDTGHSSWNTSADLESHVLELKNEAEDVGMRMKKCEQLLSRENSNLNKAMRGMEKELERVRSRVDELWTQLPRLGAILAPLEIHLVQQGDGSKSQTPVDTSTSERQASQVRAQTPVEALKPLSQLIEGTLQKCIDELRTDLMTSVVDVKGVLATKTTEGRQLQETVTQLQGQVEGLATSQAPLRKTLPSSRWVPPGSTIALRSSVASREKATNAAVASASGLEPAVSCHARCKTPSSPHSPEASLSRPMSQSAGRLPALSKS